MPTFRLRDTGALLDETALRATIPNVSFGVVLTSDDLTLLNADPVLESPIPDTTAFQTAAHDGVVETNGQWFWNWTVTDMTSYQQAQVITDRKASLLSTINRTYTQLTTQLSTGYPKAEMDSWDVQIIEATALLAATDPSTVVTPWIDAACVPRGLDRVALADRISRLDTAYRQIHGVLTGTRQALEEQIDAATTLDQLDAIVWPATSSDPSDPPSQDPPEGTTPAI